MAIASCRARHRRTRRRNPTASTGTGAQRIGPCMPAAADPKPLPKRNRRSAGCSTPESRPRRGLDHTSRKPACCRRTDRHVDPPRCRATYDPGNRRYFSRVRRRRDADGNEGMQPMTMTDAERDAWAQADRILDRLLYLAPRSRRAHLACMDIDDALRDHVDRLLAAMESDDGLLDHPERMLPSLTRHALRGRRLGRWELEAEIGRGGVAVVYRARSLDGPTGQVAAVKILTLGALADAGRDQFLREQQMLLRLRHPYIAPLHDAGIAEDGTPWLAMALVEGARIDDWCEARTLDAHARVRLVLQVCEAVAHAHRSLVIHRDIKPSSVLVDQDGHVRLLDFGIARLGDGGDERTATALRALTPEYAAPEQFSGAPATTAMDVYGIGALLYRLLAGVGPRPDGARDGSITGQPPSRAGRDAAAPARRLGRGLRGDLDAIVMKALATRPDDRYAGADALSDDLRRWLDGRAVRAQPPGIAYRLRKAFARHRLPMVAGMLVLLAVLAGLAVALWQAEQAQLAQQRAEAALKRSNAVRDFLFELFRSTSPDRPREELPTTAEVFEEAARRAPEKFAGDPETLAQFLAALAQVHESRGLDSVDLRRQVLALRVRRYAQAPAALARAQAALGYALASTRPDEAGRLLDESIATLERIAPDSGDLVDAYRNRATLAMHQGDGDARLRYGILARDLLLRMPDAGSEERFYAAGYVAEGHHQAGDHAQALAGYDLALSLAGDVYDHLHLDVVVLRANRAGVLSHQGRFGEAEAEFRAANREFARIFERPRPNMLVNLHELEIIYLRQGRHADALRMRDAWDRMLEASAAGDERRELEDAKSKVWRAYILARTGEHERAALLLDAGMPYFESDTGTRARNRMIGLNARVRMLCDAAAPAGIPEELAVALELAPAMKGDRLVHAFEAHALAGLCELRHGRPRAALARLEEAAALESGLPPGDAALVAERLLWRGDALHALGEQGAARQAWTDAQRRLPAPAFEHHPLHAALGRRSREPANPH